MIKNVVLYNQDKVKRFADEVKMSSIEAIIFLIENHGFDKCYDEYCFDGKINRMIVTNENIDIMINNYRGATNN